MGGGVLVMVMVWLWWQTDISMVGVVPPLQWWWCPHAAPAMGVVVVVVVVASCFLHGCGSTPLHPCCSCCCGGDGDAPPPCCPCHCGPCCCGGDHTLAAVLLVEQWDLTERLQEQRRNPKGHCMARQDELRTGIKMFYARKETPWDLWHC